MPRGIVSQTPRSGLLWRSSSLSGTTQLSPATVDIRDIVQATVRSQNLQFLIREVRGRLRNKPLRQSIIDELTKK